MIKNTLLTSAAAFLSLSACEKSTPNETAPDIDSANVMPIVATYDFITKSIISDIAFSPNDVASWLGAIAVIDERGTLRFSDIEAISSTAASGQHVMAIGFDREKAPALFAVANSSGSWRGYVESSDGFDFNPAPIIGAPDREIRICRPDGSAVNHVVGITPSGDLIRYDISISNDSILGFKTPATVSTRVKNSTFCIATPNGSILVRTQDGLSLVEQNGEIIARAKVDVNSAAYLNDDTLIAISGGSLVQLDSRDFSITRRFSIEDGLSMKGVKRIGGVFSTSSPYGGTAFNEGAIFLTDADSPRVVVIARRYFLDQIAPQLTQPDTAAPLP